MLSFTPKLFGKNMEVIEDRYIGKLDVEAVEITEAKKTERMLNKL